VKYLIITDTHFGVKSDSEIFLNYSKKFIDDIIFPFIDLNKITHIIHAGDFFDRRQAVNINTLRWVREHFLNPIKARGIKLDIIIGNHDTYYKNTNDVNTPSMTFANDIQYDNITIYKETAEVGEFLYVPWITSENRLETFDRIAATNKKFVIGHLQLTGYKMYEGVVCDEGIDPGIFNKFESVMSGHFHTKNSGRNVHYLGCMWDLKFNDIHDKKGFHTFDTDTATLEFFENPDKMFMKVVYDETKKNKYTVEDLLKFQNRYINVVIKTKSDVVQFDKFVETVLACNPIKVSYLDLSMVSNLAADEGEHDAQLDLSEDTLTLIKKSLDDTQYAKLFLTGDTKTELTNLLSELYIKALSV